MFLHGSLAPPLHVEMEEVENNFDILGGSYGLRGVSPGFFLLKPTCTSQPGARQKTPWVDGGNMEWNFERLHRGMGLK